MACSSPAQQSLITPFLPALPPIGGAAGAGAGLVTPQNRAQRLPAGPAAKGLPGDFYLHNDRIRLLIQAPGRAGEMLGYGGNPINLDRVRGTSDPGQTNFGEIAPFLNASHTVDFSRVEIVRDGSAGGAAVIRAWGTAVVQTYFNIAGFVDGLGILKFDSVTPPNIEVVATYILAPGDDHLRVVYTIYNPTDAAQEIAIGTWLDARGQVQFFTPGAGYGEGGFRDLSALLGSTRGTDFFVGDTPSGAFAVVPAVRGIQEKTTNAVLFVAGAGVAVFEAAGFLKAISESKFIVPPRAGKSFEVYLVAGADAGDVVGKVSALRGQSLGTLGGTVTSAGAPVADARVAFFDGRDDVVSVVRTASDGSYRAPLEPGTYKVQADQPGHPRSAVETVSVSAGATASANLTLGQAAELRYTIVDGAGAPLPGRLIVLGDPPTAPDRRFRDVSRDALNRGIIRIAHSRRGTSDMDGVIRLEPGTYRVVVTHGSEFSWFDQKVTLVAGENPRLMVTLHRVVETPGYVACDFHQHAVRSPDSTVALEDRVSGYIAGGIEFIGSSDHDFHTDYGPVIAAMGERDRLGSMVGVEATPFDYGHFNAFPLPADPNSPSGGAVDWGNGELGNLAPGRIFKQLRNLGATVVQVNHARSTNPQQGAINTFQAYFDRAALTFDFTTGTFYGDKAAQPVANEFMRIAVNEPMWSDDFDTIELYNGFSLADYDNDGVVEDHKVEVLMRDWFNFLSLGKLVTAVGNTDSHSRYRTVLDAPRTYVRVPDDASIGSVTKEDVLEGLKVHRDAIVTNGPFLTLHVNGSAEPSIGKVVTDTDGEVDLTIRIQAPTWMELNRLEIYSNHTFRIPPPAGAGHDPLTPRMSITLSENPQEGEARIEKVSVAGGGERWEATVALTGFMLPDPGKDAWIVAIVRGDRGLFPYIPSDVPSSVPMADLLEPGASVGGVFPMAITNPAFVDRDGNGKYDAPKLP